MADGESESGQTATQPPTDVKTVLIAIDASKQAEFAVNFYFDNLHREGNRVILVHIIELPEVHQSRQVYLSPAGLAELWQEEQAKSKDLEAKYRDIVRARGMSDVKMRCDSGMKPGNVITHVAEEEGAGMIIMGTRGMGTIRRTILGSVSDYVVHHAHCPVVVCRQ